MQEKWFALRLAQLRNLKGVSARDMSLSLGQNAGYINNIENGKALPSMSSFFAICDYLGVTPELFFDTGSANPRQAEQMISQFKTLSAKDQAALCTLIASLSKNA